MIRLLLDENLPKKLKYRFGDQYDVTTVPEQGWSSLKNGDLLKAMQGAGLSYLVTADKKLSYQQHYRQWNVSLIVLDTVDNQYETILPLVAVIKALFEQGAIQEYNLIRP